MLIVYNGVSIEVASKAKRESIISILLREDKPVLSMENPPKVEIKTRRRMGKRKPYAPDEKRKIYNAFWFEHKSVRTLAREFGRSYGAVANLIHNLNQFWGTPAVDSSPEPVAEPALSESSQTKDEGFDF